MDFNEVVGVWNLSLIEEISRTHTSGIFKVKQKSQEYVLKVLNPKGQIHECNGHIALEAYCGQGSVRLIDKIENFLLLELADGESLNTIVERGEDTFACHIICDVIEKLHNLECCPPKNLPNLAKQFESLIKRGKNSPKDSVLYKSLVVAEELLATEDSITLLHGDIHHQNILHSSTRGWLAIDPQPLFGERTYEFANCFFNPEDCPSIVESSERIISMANVFAKKAEIDPIRILKFAFAHGGLSLSWQLDEGQNADQ